MRKLAGATLACLILLAPASSALAQQCPQTSLGDVENEVMCPVCGTPLALATEAPQAQRQRAFIERQIGDCRSKDQIKRALVAEYGPAVLALPGDEGDEGGIDDLLVYVVPALGLLLAAGAIGFAALRWRGRRPAEAAERPAVQSSRLDDDMERYDL